MANVKTPHFTAVATSVLFLNLAGCGSQKGATAPQPAATAAAPASTSAPPESWDQLFAREVQKPLTSTRLALLGGKLSLEVPTAEKPVVQENAAEGAAGISMPLGTELAMSCTVFLKEIDPASTLRNIIQGAREKVHIERMAPAGVTILGDNPAVFLTALYTVGEPPKKSMGLLKAAVWTGSQGSLLCTHDEVGYAKSFEDIFGKVASSFRQTGVQPARYEEIAIARLGESAVGFSHSRIFATKDGGTVSLDRSTMLLPRAADEVAFDDDVSTQVVDGKGQITRVVHVEVEAGAVTTNVQLERAGKQWKYTGTVQGKPIEGTFKTRDKRGPVASVEIPRELKSKLLSGKARELKLEEYHPSIDPVGTVDVIYRKQDDGRLSMSMGPVQVTGSVDANGHFELVTIPAGGQMLTIERKFERGTP